MRSRNLAAYITTLTSHPVACDVTGVKDAQRQVLQNSKHGVVRFVRCMQCTLLIFTIRGEISALVLLSKTCGTDCFHWLFIVSKLSIVARMAPPACLAKSLNVSHSLISFHFWNLFLLRQQLYGRFTGISDIAVMFCTKYSKTSLIQSHWDCEKSSN
uniref:Uncharacterized protein n=1 Tax=Rhipicephalus zambeziensis TaxID=60191 RepID=A0A224Y5K3_9ACAR